ncbi:MAG TPA: hypothetical protein VFZ40_21270 [Pyrinomonadaceae bacterium]
MRTKINREEIAAAVVEVIQGWHFDIQITENTDFAIDIPIDKATKGLYYYAIKISLEKLGYSFCDFSPKDCEDAETVKDIVDAVWDDFDPKSKRVF